MGRPCWGGPRCVSGPNDWLWLDMQGGVKVYRGAAAAARHYVEADHSRVDDYYLAEGKPGLRSGSSPLPTAVSSASVSWTVTATRAGLPDSIR